MSYTPSSSVVAARKALATRLSDIRADAGLTSSELSERCGWHKSKTSRLQAGLSAPTESDIRAWCHACGAADRIDELITASRTAETMYMDWRRMERAGLRQAQEAVRDIYERTRAFRVYASRVVPGMVQTREYTTAVLQAVQRSRTVIDDVVAAVDARMARQEMVLSGGRTFALEPSSQFHAIAFCPTGSGWRGTTADSCRASSETNRSGGARPRTRMPRS
ncbi:Scr1 family TA system antitoxin-like transcriptional regulator [Kitasatospora sp. NPDC001527]|uniref:Scr1 family TA system antitoxin-like transcriptional regulator n=1 Tax=Kitasatospora sp. NPDC001527 TaxID=3154519 RepID=UPI00332C37E9